MPTHVWTDGGRLFVDMLFEKMCSISELKPLTAMEYQPHTNNQDKHFNKMIINSSGL